jgi:hypothetical protein
MIHYADTDPIYRRRTSEESQGRFNDSYVSSDISWLFWSSERKVKC